MREQMDAFAAQRDAELSSADTTLEPQVRDALDMLYDGEDDWYAQLVAAAEDVWLATYEQVPGAGEPTLSDITTFGNEMAAQLEETSTRYGMATDAQVGAVTRWVSTYTINNATFVATAAAGGPDSANVWVTMRDQDVRASHAALDGEIQPVGGTFEVDGVSLHFPGEPVGPPDAWINCRCVLMPLEAQMTAAATTVAPTMPTITFNGDPTTTTTTTMGTSTSGVVTTTFAEDAADAPTEGYDGLEHTVTWHGILAPVDVTSGDGRQLAAEALTHRDLPLPLTWQKMSADRHNGSVVVGNITRIWEEDGLIKGEGEFASTPESDEVVALVADRMLRGVSVDLDNTVFELVSEDGQPFDLESYAPGDPEPITRAVGGRITSASIVAIPAFQEAFIALGPWGDTEAAEPVLTAAGGCIPCAASEMDGYYEALQPFAISEGEWDGSASRFNDDQWKRATIVDRGESYSTPKERYAVPIKEPNGDLSRAAVHNAAARIDQVDAPADAVAAGKRKLVAAYRQLDETPPDSLQAAAVAWSGVYAAAPPFPPKEADDTDDGADDSMDAPEVGDTVTWEDDEGEHTGVVSSIGEGPNATAMVTVDGEDFEVPVADLTVVDDDAAEPADGGDAPPFAVTSNPGTHDGPGWITNPEDTQRLRTYWTRGEGAAKIRWGQPGDFNRCRTQLAKYIPNPHYLAGTCANMHKVALGVWPGQEGGPADVTASAAPAWHLVASGETPAAAPPAAWFTDPQFSELTPLTVIEGHESGRVRVFGHLAAWNSCHIGLGLGVGDGSGCVSPPTSASNYAYFRTGGVRTAEGDIVPVGHITLGTGHAPASMASRPAAAHYDNTGTVVADIAVGEDEYGIWFSGAVRPGADLAALEGAALSGDWRTPYPGSGYELVAALGVNVPGFPIPRLQIAASAEGPSTLVASGVVLPYGTASTFDATAMAKDVYNHVQAIEARAGRRRQISAQMRALRRSQLTARMGGC